MEINGVSLQDFERIVNRVSRDLYGGNLKVNDDAHSLPGKRRPNTRARLVARDSRAHGARTTWTGRHGPYASWEAYRDVLDALFTEYPDARVRTGLANYVGRAGFLETFPATAYHNVGSTFNPLTMPDLTVYPAAVDIALRERDAHRSAVEILAEARAARPADRERAETARSHDAESAIQEIDKLLAEVAGEGWTNPYEHEDSPARKLA